MKRIIIAIFAQILVVSLANAQSADRSSFYSYGNLFSTDLIAQASNSPDSIDATVFYKIAFDALVFENPAENKYQSIFQIEIAFRDKAGIIRRRTIKTDTAFAKSYEQSKSKFDYVSGIINTRLPNSEYLALVEYSDTRNQKLSKASIEFSAFDKLTNKSSSCSPIFLTKNVNGYDLYQLQKAAPFSSNPLTIIIPVASNEQSNSFSYVISKKENKTEANWGEFNKIIGSADFLENKVLSFDHQNSDIKAKLLPADLKQNGLKFGLLKVELSGNSFVPGTYTLLMINDKSKDSLSINFKILWENMPLALRNPEYAVETMKYVLTEEQLDQMDSGSNAEILKKILAYWQKQDPTPETPYNEAMAEYFRRVDYAFFNFQTIAVKDGALSDKGMIYILYGRPSSTNSSLSEERANEVWVYEKLNKQFTFELISPGEYRLTNIKE